MGTPGSVGFLRMRILAVLTLLIALAAAGTARADGGVYVALGDSYTSGPLIPNQHGDPIDCGRSDHNYPSLVSEAFKVATFVDVSCGSAETKHMTEPQTDLPAGGTNPPQFNGLRADATLVTVGHRRQRRRPRGRGREVRAARRHEPDRARLPRLLGARRQRHRWTRRSRRPKPKIAAVLQGIHQRSPLARVAIVGYPGPAAEERRELLADGPAQPRRHRVHRRAARSASTR